MKQKGKQREKLGLQCGNPNELHSPSGVLLLSAVERDSSVSALQS